MNKIIYFLGNLSHLILFNWRFGKKIIEVFDAITVFFTGSEKAYPEKSDLVPVKVRSHHTRK